MAKYKVLRNFKTELLTGKMKFFEAGTFFEINTQRSSSLVELRSRLRLGFIRELIDEKPAKKVEKIGKETKKTEKKIIKKKKARK